MSARYTIELSVIDKHTGEASRRCVDSDNFPIYEERFVDDIRNPAPFVGGPVDFDGLVGVMKNREFRKRILIDAARQLAGELGDFIEDKEGWNGESRRDTIKQSYRGRRGR